MPELPEVETVVRSLQGQILNQKIKSIRVFSVKNFIGTPLSVQGQDIIGVDRRAKYIIINLSQGYLVGHLRMTGKLFAVVKTQGQLEQVVKDFGKHLRVLLELEHCYLLFQDQRKFGFLQTCDSLDWLESKLGCEPLTEQFTLNYLVKICQSARQIKALLLDQSKVAGLGNIYVDEVLWQAGIHPQTCANRITDLQLQVLHGAIPEILNRSILAQGTTFLSYTFAGNQEGKFASKLQVFNRAGQPCFRCGTLIIKMRVAQRGTYVCLLCQNRGR